MENKERVAIIMEEYKTLRTEIMQRNTILNGTFTVAGAVGAGIIGLMVQHTAYMAGGLALIVLVSLVGLAWLLVDHDSRAASSRLQEIEEYVNVLAGERLLCWEREHGLDAVGYGARAKSGLNKLKGIAGKR